MSSPASPPPPRSSPIASPLAAGRQAVKLQQKGLTVDLLQLLPPKIIGRGKDGKVFVRHLPICVRKNDGKQQAREVVTTGVELKVSTKVATDGKTMFCSTDTGFASTGTRSGLGTDTSRTEQQQLFSLYVTKKDDTLTSIAEKMSSSSFPSASVLNLILEGNKHSKNTRLAAITRWPEVRDEVENATGGGKLGKAEALELRRLWGDLSSPDGRTEAMPNFIPKYKLLIFQRKKWQPLSSFPDIDTEDVDRAVDLDKKLGVNMVLRVPVTEEWGSSDLTQTFRDVWDEPDFKFEQLGLCILHCLMRTTESAIKKMIAQIQAARWGGQRGRHYLQPSHAAAGCAPAHQEEGATECRLQGLRGHRRQRRRGGAGAR